MRPVVGIGDVGEIFLGEGGGGAPKSWEEGADTPVWLALQGEGGPNKGFFQDRKPHPW